MSRTLSLRTFLPVAFLPLLLPACVAHAGAPHVYDRSGTVIAVAHDSGYRYRVESAGEIYTMLCARVRIIQFTPSQCNWNGHPIAKGDAVRFRIEGDAAYTPTSSGGEERFILQMTESKLLPPLLPAPAGLEAAVVLGLGFAPLGSMRTITPASIPTAPATDSATSSGSMAPVVAIPVTGGAPVVVIPTSPASGSVVTGIPATGGAPITAISVAPSAVDPPTVAPAATPAPDPISLGPQWIHILRLQTESHIYDLACAGRNCKLNGALIQTGDPLVLRMQKKWAYVSSAGHPREQRFAILTVRNLEDPPANPM